jgi:hypothetical protein
MKPLLYIRDMGPYKPKSRKLRGADTDQNYITHAAIYYLHKPRRCSKMASFQSPVEQKTQAQPAYTQMIHPLAARLR